MLGSDVPEELFIAAGYLPVRICGDPHADNEHSADRYIERAFDPLLRSRFRRIVDGSYSYLDRLIITSSSDALVRIYYYLRELRRVEPKLPIPELYFFDFLHTRFRSSALYNRERLLELKKAIEKWRGCPLADEEIKRAVAICNENRRLLREVAALRRKNQVSGVEALKIIGASMFMPREEHSFLLREFLKEVQGRPALSGVPLFITGSIQDHPYFYELVESCGAVIISEDHDWGERHFEGEIDSEANWLDAIIDRYHLRTPSVNQSTVSERVDALLKLILDCGAEGVIFYILEMDDAPSWDFPEQRRALEKMGIPVLLLERQPYRLENLPELRRQVEAFIEAISKKRPFVQARPAFGQSEIGSVDEHPSVSLPSKTGTIAPRGAFSVKRLRSAVEATAYQKEWFLRTRERVLRGEPFAIVNADVPQEIFRAMDLPYVVNQWWAAVCSAKQLSPRYLGLMKERGYRDNLCRYCSLSLASALDPKKEKAPWGGLPKPTIAVTRLTCDAQGKIFELWAREFGVSYFPLENTVPQYVPQRWWEKAPYRWEELFEGHRLDLMVEELKALIRFLETATGRSFNETRFKKIMDLINQQEEYNRLTRDLIATTVPAPVSITDQVPSVMIPQWHRGSEWGVKAARMFYEEVKELVERKAAACQNERIRLMWLGTGLWFNLGFYQYFEQRYGAVFVWSIYLGLAADAYARYGGDPLRALASRFVGMEDMLHMPPWNVDWYLKEAQTNKIDAMVHLVAESCTQAVQGSYFIKQAFEKAGIPVLELRADTVDARSWDENQMTAQMESFLENRLGVKPR